MAHGHTNRSRQTIIFDVNVRDKGQVFQWRTLKPAQRDKQYEFMTDWSPEPGYSNTEALNPSRIGFWGTSWYAHGRAMRGGGLKLNKSHPSIQRP